MDHRDQHGLLRVLLFRKPLPWMVMSQSNNDISGRSCLLDVFLNILNIDTLETKT